MRIILPRVITALVTAPLFLWVLYLGGLPFLLFMFFLVFLALWEFHGMAEAGGYATQSWCGLIGGVLLVAAMGFPGMKISIPFSAQSPAFILIFLVFVFVMREVFRRDKSLSMLRISMSGLGLLFVVMPLGYFMLLRELRGPHGDLFFIGRDISFFLVLLIWIQDIAAWAVGLLAGKRRLAPAISPKKSWEGAVAGLSAAVLLALFLHEVWLKPEFTRMEIALLAGVLGVLAQLSDLAESLMKRCFGVKDSSSLLPGHGGVLDRFDSFIFSAPFLYFYLIVTGRC